MLPLFDVIAAYWPVFRRFAAFQHIFASRMRVRYVGAALRATPRFDVFAMMPSFATASMP
jgi:hypothetical protein